MSCAMEIATPPSFAVKAMTMLRSKPLRSIAATFVNEHARLFSVEWQWQVTIGCTDFLPLKENVRRQ